MNQILINRQTSIYLDILRLGAALGVFFTHCSLTFFSNNLYLNQETGHKLVVIFFVLSGYLITYTTYLKKKNLESYIIDRISRLYSVVIPALLITFICDKIGKNINPQPYFSEISSGHTFFRYVFSITFLNQIWQFCIKPSSNSPFWSISYEFWFYMIFGAYLYIENSFKKICALLLITLIIGYKIMLLLPIWMLGSILFHIAKRFRISTVTSIFGFIFSFIVMIFFVIYPIHTQLYIDFILFKPFYFSTYYMLDFFIGISVFLNIYFVAACRNNLLINNNLKIFKVINLLSSKTFSLYLFHFPILLLIGACFKYDKGSYLQTLLLAFIVLILIYIISNYTENKRDKIKLTLFFLYNFILRREQIQNIHK